MDRHANMAMATVGIKIDKAVVAVGKVTFHATNSSKKTVHEMPVSPIKSLNDVLPYIDDEERVDEDAAGHLGEISELEPGQDGSLTVNLKPGLYLPFCNIPGHYVAGMWTAPSHICSRATGQTALQTASVFQLAEMPDKKHKWSPCQ